MHQEIQEFWFREIQPAQCRKKDAAFGRLIAGRIGDVHALACITPAGKDMLPDGDAVVKFCAVHVRSSRQFIVANAGSARPHGGLFSLPVPLTEHGGLQRK